MSMEYSCSVIETIARTLSVKSIRTEKPEGFKFKAGQFAKIKINGDSKYLSISSSPLRNYLEFTKRDTQSNFSRKFFNIKADEKVVIEGPFGNFFLQDNENKIAFIVGGIGITPVFSILEDAFLKLETRDFSLFYGNKFLDDIPFQKELSFFQSQLNLKIFYFIEDLANTPDDKQIFCGILDFNKIRICLTDINERKIYVCGPPSMVDTIISQIKIIGTIENVKTEKIFGYTKGA